MRRIDGLGLGLLMAALSGCSTQAASDERALSKTARALDSDEPPILGPEIGTDQPIPTAIDTGHNPVIGSDGVGFLAVQEINEHIRAVRVDGAGQVLDSDWLDLGEPGVYQYYPSIAFGAGHYLITWSQVDADGNGSIHGRFVQADGAIEGLASFETTAAPAWYTSVAWAGDHFISIWTGPDAGSNYNVQVASLDSSGAPIAGSQHVVSTSGFVSDPIVSANANQGFVVWQDYTHTEETGDVSFVRGARIAADGSVLDLGGIALSAQPSGQRYVTATTDGTNFLAAWETNDELPTVVGSLVGVDGAIALQDIAISRSTQGSGMPSTAFDGANYLVAWTDGRDEGSVYGALVSPAGSVLGADDVKLALGKPRYAPDGVDRTALAFNGSNYLLSFLGVGIEGSLISPQESLLVGGISLTALPNHQGYPQAVWDGSNYLVLFHNEGADFTDTVTRAVHIDGSGHVLEPGGLELSDLAQASYTSALASNGLGSALVIGHDYDGSFWKRTVATNGNVSAQAPWSTPANALSIAIAGRASGYLIATSTGDYNMGSVLGRIVDGNGDGGTDFPIADTTGSWEAWPFASADGYLLGYVNGGTQLVSISAAGTVGSSVQLSSDPASVSGATNGTQTLVVWAPSQNSVVYGQLFADGALVGEPLLLANNGSGFAASVTWDGTSFWVAWDSPDYQLYTRRVGADGTIGEQYALAVPENSGPVLSSDGNGQMLLSYLHWLEQAQSRRVQSRLMGRGADIVLGNGSGGASSNSGGSTGNGDPFSFAGEPSESGGTPSQGGAPGQGGSLSQAGSSAHGGNDSGSGGAPNIQDLLNCACRLHGGESSHDGVLGAPLVLFALAAMRRKQRDSR